MPIGTLFVSPEWHSTEEGQNALECLKYRQLNIRKPFYLLEKPVFPDPYPDVFEYKLFLSGKPGVGKSFLAAQLSATPIQNLEYQETIGLNKYMAYWPAKIAEVDRTVLFKINVLDVSEKSLLNYEHLTKEALTEVDGVIFVFSFTDKSSLTELPHRITRVLNDCADKNTTSGNTAAKPCTLVMGTKLDQQTDIELTHADVADFEGNWSLKVLTLGCSPPLVHHDPSSPQSGMLVPPGALEAGTELVASTLNYICDQLWIRDQLQAGKIGQGGVSR